MIQFYTLLQVQFIIIIKINNVNQNFVNLEPILKNGLNYR